MYRICIHKPTGRLIEMQSGGREERLPEEAFEKDGGHAAHLEAADALEAMRLDTLRSNALNAGYKEEDLDVRWATKEEWAAISATLNTPTPEQVAAREKEALIQAKIREQAIAALVAEGKLAPDGKVVVK